MEKKQTTEPEKKNGHKPEPTVLSGQMSAFDAVAEPLGGLLGASGNGAFESRAAQLNNSDLSTIQHQRIAKQIGQVQGNQHLQTLLSPPQKDKASLQIQNLGSASPDAPIIQSWAPPDIQVMANVHDLELIDAFRLYAQEALSPTPNWPSRRAAIQQAIRDRLSNLARTGQMNILDNLLNQLETTLFHFLEHQAIEHEPPS